VRLERHSFKRSRWMGGAASRPLCLSL
jgi:hypothetical protein